MKIIVEINAKEMSAIDTKDLVNCLKFNLESFEFDCDMTGLPVPSIKIDIEEDGEHFRSSYDSEGLEIDEQLKSHS